MQSSVSFTKIRAKYAGSFGICVLSNSLRPGDAYMSLDIFVNIYSGNSFFSIWRKAITWSNADILSIGCKAERTKLQCNLHQNTTVIYQENTFEIVVCKISAILSGPACVYWVSSTQMAQPIISMA